MKSVAGKTGFGAAEEIDATPKAGIESMTAAPLRYVGEGEYIVGVPARDLSAEEALRYAAAIAEVEATTGRALYRAAAQ
jgi:hypothetical protein